MANQDIFSTKAKEYAASRPAYAPQAVELIFQRMISPGQWAADMGSGTGILSREFLARGVEVYAVEPNAAMRAQAEALYSGAKGFHSVAASAEDTGLPACSVSLVTAASAFHWFDVPAFRKECLRLLKPDGLVCLLINGRIYDPFTQRQHEICKQYCCRYTSLRHGLEKTLEAAAAFFQGEYWIERFDFPLAYTKKAFITRSLSSSYAPEKDAEGYAAYLRALQTLANDAFEGEDMVIANETVMLWGTLTGS